MVSVVKLQECGEELVDLAVACPGIVIQLDKARRGSESTAYARKTVARMLATAQRNLPEGMSFVVNDAWRPRAAQARYFAYYQRQVAVAHPDWGAKQIYAEAAKFAIPPDASYRAGHLTGAAIDLVLFRNGRRLPMQSRDLAFDRRAHTDSAQLQAHINRNRKLLGDSMLGAGFVNYPNEFWHYSYGDVMWAELTGHSTAIYGAIDGP